MANDIYLTISGNLAADPELRTTPNGNSVVSFTVMSTPRNFNSKTQTWEAGETLAQRCTAWRQLAENINKSARKGTSVIVYGKLTNHRFEDKDGNPRARTEIQVEDFGVSLKNAVADITKTNQGSNYNNSGSFNSSAQSNEFQNSFSSNSIPTISSDDVAQDVANPLQKPVDTQSEINQTPVDYDPYTNSNTSNEAPTTAATADQDNPFK